MAIDTAAKRASATILFPQAIGILPSGTMDRQAATWVYTGIAAGALTLPAYELFSALSEMMMTLAEWSYLLPTLAKSSTLHDNLVENSKI